jgi:hypothetical protein
MSQGAPGTFHLSLEGEQKFFHCVYVDFLDWFISLVGLFPWLVLFLG